MKIIVRTLVIALAVTGAIATTSAKASSARTTVNLSKTSAMPVPRCEPGDPNGCGIFD
jgi:ribosomal protein L17